MLLDWVGDLLSPPECAACSAPLGGRFVFCVPCAASVERCDGSADPVAFGQYGGALARAIQRFKYEQGAHLARPLGALARTACRRAGVRAEIVVPVPLHPRRLVERGYNQSALLARHVAKELGARLATGVLARTVETSAQVELTREARRTNVERAFSVRSAPLVEGRSVVLVDDVSTTGATMAACRNALIRAGAGRVISVVVARTMPSELGISSEAR